MKKTQEGKAYLSWGSFNG